MAGQENGSCPSATADLLLTEGIVDVLQEKGILRPEDLDRAVDKAAAQARRLPPALIRRSKVMAIIEAMRSRFRWLRQNAAH